MPTKSASFPKLKKFRHKLQCVFDRNDIYPWPWIFADEVVTSSIAKVTGGKLSLVVEEYDHGYLRHYLSFAEVDKFGERTLGKLLESERYFEKVMRKVYVLSSELKTFSDRMRKQDFAAFSDKDLFRTVTAYVSLLKKVRAWGWVPPLVDGMKTPFLSNESLDHLQRELKGITRAEINEIYSLLASPDRFGEVQKSELEKFALLKSIGPAEFAKFKSAKDAVAALKKLKAKSQKKILAYVSKFAWLTYNYEGPEFDLAAFHKQVKKTGFEQAMREWKKIIAHQKETNRRKKKLVRQTHLSKKALHVLRMAREFGQLKEYRKSVYQHSYVAAERPVRELASRLGLSFMQIRFLSLDEIEEALFSGRKVKDIAEERINYSVAIIKDGRSVYLQGPVAVEAIDYYRKKDKHVEKKEFKGQVAYPGKVRGRAKIILVARDLVKMKKGDVLVSASTNPDLLMGMKKAAAIVTDNGGVTSHAAIVSRELKTPCVIGTVDITKHVRDGDEVLVDAQAGLVKILR